MAEKGKPFKVVGYYAKCLFCGTRLDINTNPGACYCCKEHEVLFRKRQEGNIKKGVCYRCGSPKLTEKEKNNKEKAKICETCRHDIFKMAKNIDKLGKRMMGEKW